MKKITLDIIADETKIGIRLKLRKDKFNLLLKKELHIKQKKSTTPGDRR